MEKLRMETISNVEKNISMIEKIFPGCIDEAQDSRGKWVKVVNMDRLGQLISYDTKNYKESYEFSWYGKRKAIIETNESFRGTLRPCISKSVDWDTTENIYIEGDNFDSLKLLQESYLNKVKMIYIDPPYNTGNDRFIYNDKYEMSKEEYDKYTDNYDENGNKQFVENNSSDPRFHSKWCSMIFQRLLLSRSLLTEDGAIFISIDDKEQENLKKICDEVFGSSNYISTIVWQHSIQPKGYLGKFSIQHSYILIYAKSKEKFNLGSLDRTEEDNKSYSNPDNDPNGPWRSGDVRNALYRPNLIYDVVAPNGNIIKPCDNGWRWSKETLESKIKTGEIIFNNEQTKIIRKIYLKNLDGRAPETIWFGKDVGTTREGVKELKELFEKTPFDTPKPTKLIERCITLMNDPNMIVLDFFSGSATTADAVMRANLNDGGNRKWILVQYPEKCDKEGIEYDTICDIGEERIRLVAKKIRNDNKILDCGFRVFKIDDSNMNDIYYSSDDYSQDMLKMMESNIKEDRTDLDLLFGCLLEWGLPLSMPYVSEEIEGYKVHTYNDGDLIACFEKNVPESVIKEIAKREPLRVVFRDNSFMNSPSKINVEEIFKLISPDTRIKVI